MVEELQRQHAAGAVQVDARLAMNVPEWVALLSRAAANESASWLAAQLTDKMHLTSRTLTRGGRVMVKKVPDDAPWLVAEAEFNRLFAAAICRLAIAAHGHEATVRVFRADSTKQRIWRPGGVRSIRVRAADVLQGLRANQRQVDGLRGPNSGLSVELAK